MIIVLLICIIILILTFTTAEYSLGLFLMGFVVTTYYVANYELRKFAGEGSGDLLASGFIYPFLMIVNTNVIIAIAMWALLVLWLMSMDVFLPQWKASRRKLFTMGILSAILVITNVYVLMLVIPGLLTGIYKSRNNIKYSLAFVTGAVWLGMGYWLLNMAYRDFATYFKSMVYMPIMGNPSELLYFKYFVIVINVLLSLWVLYTYMNRHQWRPEIRYLILLILPVSIISIFVSIFAPLPAVVVSIPTFHIIWNLQVRKGYFSPALLLSVIVMVWLNQSYLINLLNLHY